MKIQMQMNPEQAAAFMKLYMEGKLDEVIEGFQVTDEANLAADSKPVPKWLRVQIIRMTSGCAALVCGVSSLLATETALAWIPGLLAAVTSVAYSVRSRGGYWVAGFALVVNVAAVSVWGYRAATTDNSGLVATELNENADKKQELKIAKITIQEEDGTEAFANLADEMSVKIAEEERHRPKLKIVLLGKMTPEEMTLFDETFKAGTIAFRKWAEDPTDENFEAYLAIDKKLPKLRYEMRLEKQDYDVSPGRQHVVLKRGRDVIFDKHIIIPNGSQIICSISRTQAGKIAVKFTPDIIKE